MKSKNEKGVNKTMKIKLGNNIIQLKKKDVLFAKNLIYKHIGIVSNNCKKNHSYHMMFIYLFILQQITQDELLKLLDNNYEEIQKLSELEVNKNG